MHLSAGVHTHANVDKEQLEDMHTYTAHSSDGTPCPTQEDTVPTHQ